MVELVDSVDLGDISSGKDFLFAACFRMEYAPVAKLVYAADLGSAAKSVGVRIPSGAPNKNRNFDTKRIEVTVLAFYAKTLCLRHFCTQRPQKKTRPGCFPGRVFAFAWALWSS